MERTVPEVISDNRVVEERSEKRVIRTPRKLIERLKEKKDTEEI